MGLWTEGRFDMRRGEGVPLVQGITGGRGRDESQLTGSDRFSDMTPLAASTGWTVGLILGIIGVIVVAAIVVAIVLLALGILRRTQTAVAGVHKLRAQTDALAGIERINDSGVRILRSARSLRKVAVGK